MDKLKAENEVVDIPVKKYVKKSSTNPVKAIVDNKVKLESSLDRHIGTGNTKTIGQKETRVGNSDDGYPMASSGEDIDLLRASDVRAATRSVRVTKQEVEEEKKDTRARLESDFAARMVKSSGDPEQSPVATARDQITTGLSNVWHHVLEYPAGIVARTMESMGVVSNQHDKHAPPPDSLSSTITVPARTKSVDAEAAEHTTDLQEAKPQLLSRSQQVANVEEERKNLTLAIKAANETTRKQEELENVQLTDLANDMKAVYEEEYGAITVDHRQSADEATSQQHQGPFSAPACIMSPKPHPLQHASVKDGVSVNSTADQHVRNFEPKYAELVDKAKVVWHETMSARQEIEAMLEQSRERKGNSLKTLIPTSLVEDVKDVRRELQDTSLTPRNASRPKSTNIGNKKVEVGKLEAVTSPNLSSSTSDHRESLSSRVEDQPTKVPEPVFTPAGSSEWNDEQPPSIESLRRSKDNSPYRVLTYDRSTGKVETSAMYEPAMVVTESADALAILSKLKNAEAYLKHFEGLEKGGYQLYSGTKRMLVFRKKDLDRAPEIDTTKAVSATREAASVPEVDSASSTKAHVASTSRWLPSSQRASKVTRQEDVFSGTVRSKGPIENVSHDDKNVTRPEEKSSDSETDSIFGRVMRSFRRTLFTIAALGSAAYAIGVVAEGIGAQAQKQKGIGDANAHGPRKRIVMTGQRPDIFTTEGSR
jgi:hypothetical protein